jgi:dTDP-4-dehydrorhamnose reductase
MKVLITGANGQLGKALSLIFKDAILADFKTLDISDFDAIQNFDVSGIEAIINAGAYTKVDEAQKPENLSLVWAVNSQGPANLAWLAAKLNIPLVHISTDYVFDGSKQGEYSEEDLFSPLSVYGASKAAGDLVVMQYPEHYIFRTSWVIGDGPNFVRSIRGLSEKGISPNVVGDQFGRLSFTATIAAGIHHALENKIPFGTYNLTNSGSKSTWQDVAKLVYELSGDDPKKVGYTTAYEYFKDKQPSANRPTNSMLSLTKIEATGFKPEDWRVKLKQYLS